MRLDVIIRPAAQREIDDLAGYIAVDNVVAARRFLAAIDETIDRLRDTPNLGRRWQSSKPSLAGMRVRTVKGFPNYLVFYEPTTNRIEVLHVLHGARNLADLLGGEADA